MKRILIVILYAVLIIPLASAQTTYDYKDTTKNDSDLSKVSTIIISENDLDSDELSQDISPLLSSSSDIFTRLAGYTFGQARFRVRGYDSKYTKVMINGVYVNDAETGRAYWSNWGGLNDAMWNRDLSPGISYSESDFGGIGGYTNIITRASEFRTQTSVSYASGNRSYNNRIMATHSTGLMSNGWAYVISGSKRWAQESYVEGSFYDAYGYFVGIEKKINSKHSVGLTGFGAPSRKGRSSPSVMEVYKLTENNFYNPNWGYQNGVKRNARVNNYHQPKIMFTHYFDINEDSKLNSTISYSFGKGGSTALNWYDSPDPRPDYYRNLPSYYQEDEFMFAHLTNLWQNDENFRQLDWDSFYHANRKNLFTVENEGGIEGNDITGNRAAYIVEERRNDIKRFDISSNYTNNLNEIVDIAAGTNVMIHKTNSFNIVNDLLGADWWLDIDQFAERDFSDNYTIQNDVDNPNKVIYEGERFGHDYIANINYINTFAQANFKFLHFDVYAGGELSYTDFWRTGNNRNGKFPDNSFGDSDRNKFINYAFKTGLNYKITGRHIVQLNLISLSKAPNFRDAYISPRTRDHVVNNLVSEKITSVDLSYLLRGKILSARLTGYYTDFKDQTFNRSFYHDELRTFVNYAMTGIDKIHYGMEFGFEAKLTSELVLNSALGFGQYLYNSRPVVTIAQDNNSEILVEDRLVYIKNYHLGGMPELASSIGLRYNAPKYWFVSVNVNYFDYTYLDINPDRRTEEALEGFVRTDPQVDDILSQVKLDNLYTVDLWGGKSWRVNGNTIGFSLSVNNLLNNKTFAIGGFEQLRYNVSDIDKFPPKYMFMYGRTYFANLYFRF